MTEAFAQSVQGFDAVTLRSDDVELTVLPELGAKIVRLVSRRTGRQWLWHPPGELRLFRNVLGDPFERSTMAGIDECLPTVAPCAVNERVLPDHGEVWSVPWQWGAEDLKTGRLRTAVRLPVTPLEFERTITLDGGNVNLAYRLTNRSEAPQPFLWALHPLFRIEPGDRIELPSEVREAIVECSLGPGGATARRGERWEWPSPAPGVRLDTMELGGSGGTFAKLFVSPAPGRWARVRNDVRGDQLTISFDAGGSGGGAPDTLGLWITRGGWNGYEHFALEPTHAAADTLAVAVDEGRCPVLAGGASAAWGVRLALGSL